MPEQWKFISPYLGLDLRVSDIDDPTKGYDARFFGGMFITSDEQVARSIMNNPLFGRDFQLEQPDKSGKLIDLDTLRSTAKLKELKQLAKLIGVSNWWTMNKDQLVEAIGHYESTPADLQHLRSVSQDLPAWLQERLQRNNKGG